MTTNKERAQEVRVAEERMNRKDARAEEKRERAAEDREAVREAGVAKEQQPSVGRIVLYNGDEPCAAIITRVHSPTCVNLTAFPGTTCITHRRDVAMGTEPGTWSWPPRV